MTTVPEGASLKILHRSQVHGMQDADLPANTDYLYILRIDLPPRFAVYHIYVAPQIAKSGRDEQWLLKNLRRATFDTCGLIDEDSDGERPW